MIKKRSIKIAGHKTSVSLEEPFWDALKVIAGREGLSLSALVERVDRERVDRERVSESAGGNLSSALRLHVLAYLRAKAGV